MKSFTLFLLSTILYVGAIAQCVAPVITASGSTTFCPGGSVTLSAPAGNAWIQKTDFGGAGRFIAASFSIGSKGYIGTGFNGSTYTKDFWEFDPATNVWTQKADFGGTGRSAATGFSIGSKGYIGTGVSGTYLEDFWEYDPATNVWTQKADFGGTARKGAAGFSIGSKGYIGTGDNGSSTKDFWEYDPATNAWTRKADFGGTGRFDATGFSIGSKGYIGTGYNGNYTKDFWEYDPANNVWTQKADFGGTGRYAATSFSIGSKGYIGTGADGGNIYKDFWEYDPSTNAWTRKADFGGTAKYAATSFSIGSKGYIGTGVSSTYLKDFWEYNPGYTYSWSPGGQTTSSISATAMDSYTVTTTNALGCSATSAATLVTVSTPVTPVIKASGSTTFCPGGSVTLSAPAGNVWTQKTDFGGAARSGATGFSIGSKGYLGTGNSSGTYTKDFWEYDPATNVWTQKADFGGAARAYATGFSIGSKGYIGTGYGITFYKDFWEYNPANNVWTQKTDFGGAARTAGAGFSIGSKGYIGTGFNGSTYTKDFWEYDPANNVWIQKADFGGAARSGATSFSISSKGYIGTGFNGSTYTKDFWEYDPTVNSWTQKADFGGTARQGAAGFSIGSKGYIGTGYNSGSYYKDFWEYDPATNVWTQKADVSSTVRAYATGFSIGSKGYIGTGSGSSYYKDFREYDLGYTYAWSPGGQTTSSISATAMGSYTVTTTNALGCSATSAATLVTVTTPVTPVITASGSTTLCPGGSVTLSAPASNVWTQKADFGGAARFLAAGFSISSKGYIGTGLNGSLTKDFWEYDPANNVWTQKADFGGTAREGATGFSIGSKGYIGIGNDGSLTKDFWEYDPSTNAWTRKADFGGTAREGATGFSIGNKGYIGTGSNGSLTKDFWEYDPANNVWTRKADFGGTAREGATGFSIGSKGYIGTGYDDSYLKDFWEYDPANNVWTQKADFGGTARLYATGFSIGSKGYISTGDDGSIYYKDFWEFNPSTNAWTRKADFGGTARLYATGFSIGSKGYISTGNDGSYHKDLREYDPGYTYTWSPGGQTTSSINITTSGNYTVTTTNVLGCSATSATTAVTANPATQITTQPQGTTTCKGSSVSFSVAATGSNLTYQWYRNGQPIYDTSSTLTISNAQVSNSGSYTVDVIGNCDTVTSNAATLTVYDNDNGAIYVDNSVPASGNGTSWATAFKELREAMNAAALCSDITTINVAKGTYKPTNDANRDSAFVMVRGGLKIYGGYPTGGGIRNISTNATILSGDIGTENTSADNSYHVVVIAGLISSADSVVLDGLTVTGGYANNFSGKNYNGITVYQNYGGGICLNGNGGAGGKIAIRNCIITNNAALFYGGGIYNELSSPAIMNCAFTGNSSYLGNGQYSDAGGGLFNYNYSSPQVINCVFTGNSAGRGGAVHNYSFSSPQMVNCTVAANSSTGGGAGMFSEYSCSPVVTNCIIWGNTGVNPGIYNTNNSTATVTYSLVQDGYAGTGNLSADPLFINAADADGADNIFGTSDDGLKLISGSPAINTGSNTGVPSGITTDITGTTRIQNGTVDMGAYEGGQCSPFTTLYVDSTIASPGNGSSWTTAFKELKDALTIAGQCSSITIINVAKGTYKPTNGANRDSAFTIYRGGLKIYGGYPSGGGTRSTAANPTILSGDIGTVNDSTDNSYHIIVIANPGSSADSLVIDGFTIAKANANGIASKLYNSVSISQSYGGGIYAGNQVNSKTVIRNCIISNNTATNGGGMRNNGGSSPALINCAFSYNNAHAGGGISNDNCLSVIRGCNFTGNNVATYGGGILNWNNSSVTVDSCTFSANYSAIGSCMYNYTGTQSISRSIFITNNASNYAGGVYNSFASPVLSGCTFSGNRAANYGGGIYNSNSPATISNCSFLNNSSVSGGGMLNSESASVITNCSFSNNSAKSGGGIFNSNHSAPTIKGCSFLNDSAYYGGGMFSDSSFAVIDSCRFAGNKASEGAGIENSHYSAPVITNSTFLNNISTNNGGGMLNYVNTRPVIKNCVFSENTATNYGGGISNFNSSSTTIINSVFSKNSALNGSAIIARTTSTCYITNCTFVPNTSFINGGFINSSGGSLVKMSNSVSTVNNFYNSGSTIVVTYSDVQGGYAGTGNINADPQFVNPADGDGSDNIWGTSDDGLRLQVGSPAQNRGNNDSIPSGITTDITGAARISNCMVDMGAYEVIDNINTYWTGKVSNAWNNSGNWCSGIPAAGAPVVIPVSAPYAPILSSPVTLGNLFIATGTSLSLNDNTLTLAGTVSSNGVITGSSSSNIVINGSGDLGTLYFDPSVDGTTNVLNNMTVNRSSSGTVTLGNKLNLTGTYTPAAGVLNSNGYLTLKSSAAGTASVATGAATGNYITGNVMAERYTDGGNAASGRRAWRLLSSPVTGITIRDAWQEGQVNNTGYGTLITGEGLSSSQAQSLGFDYIGGGNHTSIKQYDSVGNAWVPLSTNNTTGTRIPIRSHPAYMVFVRGNRTITSTSGPATLRALGTLLQGTQTIPLSPGNFTLAGNPYASAIDFGKLYIHNSTLIQNQFNIWNSKIGTYGAYVLVKRNAGNTAYEATPAPFTVSSPADDYKYIPGGSGFFLSPVSIGATGTISIEETDKASGTPPVNPFRALPSTVKELRVNLNLKDTGASVTLADGFLVQFDNYFTDSATQAGASSVKTANFNENVAVVRNAANLIVDARPDVQQTDTLFMKLWYVVKRNYQFQVKADNFASSPGMGAWLEDSYLGTRQPVSLSGDITTINFAVTSDSLSWKSNRFRIVFRNNSLMVLPVTLTSLKAAPANDGVNINWTVTNEVNLKGYTVERSADDGKTYTTVAVQGAKNGTGSVFTHYDGFDARPKTGDNLYRIRIEAKDGTISYSEVVKVTTGEDRAVEISIYPNPAASKATVHINKITGNTTIILTDAKGRDVWKKENVTDTDTVIPVAHLANGSYLVTIKSSGSVTTLKLVKAD